MIHSGVPTLSKRCNGNILPATFVSLDPTAPLHGSVKQTAANAKVFGISFGATRNAPGLLAALGGVAVPDVAGITGDEIPIYSTGDVCLLQAGAGGYTEGDDLESDANGLGITSVIAGHNVGAVAMQTVPAGSFGLVRIGASIH